MCVAQDENKVETKRNTVSQQSQNKEPANSHAVNNKFITDNDVVMWCYQRSNSPFMSANGVLAIHNVFTDPLRPGSAGLSVGTRLIGLLLSWITPFCATFTPLHVCLSLRKIETSIISYYALSSHNIYCHIAQPYLIYTLFTPVCFPFTWVLEDELVLPFGHSPDTWTPLWISVKLIPPPWLI